MIVDDYDELAEAHARLFDPVIVEPDSELYDEAGLVIFTEQDLINLAAA